MTPADTTNEGNGSFGEERDSVLHPGENFHGYIVEKLIGKGGLGTIWLVRQIGRASCRERV